MPLIWGGLLYFVRFGQFGFQWIRLLSFEWSLLKLPRTVSHNFLTTVSATWQYPIYLLVFGLLLFFYWFCTTQLRWTRANFQSESKVSYKLLPAITPGINIFKSASCNLFIAISLDKFTLVSCTKKPSYISVSNLLACPGSWFYRYYLVSPFKTKPDNLFNNSTKESV